MRDTLDYLEKEKRLRSFMETHSYDGIVLGRRDNITWLTGGEESGVINSIEEGFFFLYITPEDRTCIAYLADISRAKNEQLSGISFSFYPVNWKGADKKQYLTDEIKGKKVLSDIQLEGAEVDCNAVYRMHFPLTPYDIRNYKQLGEIADTILYETAHRIKSGMTELEIKQIFSERCACYDAAVQVLLIGSDERVWNYRHCMPVAKKISRWVMISPVLQKFGLHANIARFIHIGEPSAKIKERYEAVCCIQAETAAMCKAGTRFKDIYERQEQLYKKYGYEAEWIQHMHGAPVGYMLSDGSTLYDEKRTVQNDQTFEWFVTIPGVKSAELILNSNEQVYTLSMTGAWPGKTYYTRSGEEVILPEILIL